MVPEPEVPHLPVDLVGLFPRTVPLVACSDEELADPPVGVSASVPLQGSEGVCVVDGESEPAGHRNGWAGRLTYIERDQRPNSLQLVGLVSRPTSVSSAAT